MMPFALALVAATVAPLSVEATRAEEQRGLADMHGMMQNVNAMEDQTQSELDAMKKDAYFQKASLLETRAAAVADKMAAKAAAKPAHVVQNNLWTPPASVSDLKSLKDKSESAWRGEKSAEEAARDAFHDALATMASDDDNIYRRPDAESDSAGAFSLLETGESELSHLMSLATSKQMDQLKSYMLQPTASLLEKHSKEDVVTMRGIVHALGKVPSLLEIDSGMAQSQLSLKQVLDKTSQDLVHNSREIADAASLVQKGDDDDADLPDQPFKVDKWFTNFQKGLSHPRAFQPPAKLVSQRQDLEKTKALVSELHKKAQRAREEMQASMKQTLADAGLAKHMRADDASSED